MAQRTRIFGKSNPELTNHEYWLEQIRTGADGYIGAVNIVGDQPGYDAPYWSFDRFGMSATELPDGRWIEIAGEHEDYYDSDFCIYNDVIVHDGNGKTDIYSYPKSDFQPTDFHTATLIENKIYMVGNLGYLDERHPGWTPVYSLDINTFEISSIKTSGNVPGWISDHEAILSNKNIIISGGKVWRDNDLSPLKGKWSLSIPEFVWTKLE
jgi:hypothetical protein